MIKDKYLIEKQVDKFNKNGYTGFLNELDVNRVKNVLNKMHIKYDIYASFQDADKHIIYKAMPEVVCFEIITNNELKHSDIMGSLYNFNIDEDLLGDIVIINNHYYFIVLKSIADYFYNNFNTVGKYTVNLKKVDIPIRERMYDKLEYIVSSNRIDNIIAKIINTNRKTIDELISNKDIILNYNILTNKSYTLKENDVFSIRRYGKFKYLGINKTTKKGNLVVTINKYK